MRTGLLHILLPVDGVDLNKTLADGMAAMAGGEDGLTIKCSLDCLVCVFFS